MRLLNIIKELIVDDWDAGDIEIGQLGAPLKNVIDSKFTDCITLDDLEVLKVWTSFDEYRYCGVANVRISYLKSVQALQTRLFNLISDLYLNAGQKTYAFIIDLVGACQIHRL